MSFPIDHQTFVSFLLTAKRQTYTAGDESAKVTALLSGSKQFEYREGSLLYRDIYFGGNYFAGQETVYYEGQPVWAMTYAGGITDAASAGGITDAASDAGVVYGFLQEAMRHATPARPYRGPGTFRRDAYVYQDDGAGHLEDFWGEETITYQGQLVYRLHYSGGWLH